MRIRDGWDEARARARARAREPASLLRRDVSLSPRLPRWLAEKNRRFRFGERDERIPTIRDVILITIRRMSEGRRD